MNILSFLGSIFQPLTDVVDKVHTSDAERLSLNVELTKLQNEITGKVLDYEKQLLQAQSEIIKAEAAGSSWLQRSWRPITMMTFLVLVIFDSFGWLKNPLAPEAWTLLQLGLGGYVIGRSVEKSIPAITKAIKK